MTLPQPSSTEERVTSLRDARLVSEPGTAYHYFNPNYGVLARIVEVTSGEPFTAYLRTHIFAPLHMDDTTNVITSAETPRVAPRLAQGHILAFGVPIPRNELRGYLGGSGGVISTAEDMANYLIMQNNGGRFGGRELVSPEGLELMHSPPEGIDSPYAMGWMVMDRSAKPRVIEHSGILSTFSSDAALLPDEGYGIALLYDYYYTLADFNGIKRGLIELLMGKQPSTGGLGAGTFGIIVAALALVTLTLQMRGLLGLRRWAAKANGAPAWRLAPGIAWKFVPAALLVGLPSLVGLVAGRVFSYEQLFRSMPDVIAWLGLSAVLGITLGVLHIAIVVRRGVIPPTAGGMASRGEESNWAAKGQAS
jgi:hypothetical protein